MKRAVICVTNPQDYIGQFDHYSLMIINPAAPELRKQYLLNRADWSILITDLGIQYRDGNDYPNERLFWYTSGTTGDSKFCSFTQQQVDRLAQTIVNSYNITANDRYVGVMPLWHAHGQGFYWATKLAGCETHFLSIPEIRNITNYSPTFITAVPDVLKVVGQLSFDNLRFIRGASAPLSNNLYCYLKDKFTVPIVEAFGMTEALSHCFTNPLEGEQRIGTIGLPDGIEADIIDQQLYIKGPTLITHDWYNTGDLAARDEKGYYYILGRSADRINIKGYKLDPLSIEQQLKQRLPAIEDCVIFGSQQVNCIYTGNIDKPTVAKTLISIHSACRPTFIEQHNSIPLVNGKISRKWLQEKFKCQ